MCKIDTKPHQHLPGVVLPAYDHAHMQGALKKATRWQLYNTKAPSIIDIVDSADSALFYNILSNNGHVLHSLLPAIKESSYNLNTSTSS